MKRGHSGGISPSLTTSQSESSLSSRGFEERAKAKVVTLRRDKSKDSLSELRQTRGKDDDPQGRKNQITLTYFPARIQNKGNHASLPLRKDGISGSIKKNKSQLSQIRKEAKKDNAEYRGENTFSQLSKTECDKVENNDQAIISLTVCLIQI